ncbi:hypothetical protein DENSPDRAFT_83707 [Dentipellis sp. KUC8613]|nr:hypothetical protein DENSPDRAFT_83707 [Dentipellis sp. KUC8613]
MHANTRCGFRSPSHPHIDAVASDDCTLTLRSPATRDLAHLRHRACASSSTSAQSAVYGVQSASPPRHGDTRPTHPHRMICTSSGADCTREIVPTFTGHSTREERDSQTVSNLNEHTPMKEQVQPRTDTTPCCGDVQTRRWWPHPGHWH